MSTPRVLITGAMGFLGSHLADHYEARGWHVVGLDNLTANVVSYDYPAIGTPVIAHASQLTPSAVASVDLVVHAASPVGAAGILPAQGTLAGEIVHTTQCVVDACVVAQVPLVNISTSEIYGITGEASEDDWCNVPPGYSARLEYQVGKMAAEQVVGASVARGLRAVQIRPWNMAGPREAPGKGFVVPRFVAAALADNPLTVFEGGRQERAFTGVWDACRFICDYLPPTDTWRGQPYNVGAEENITDIMALAHRVVERLDSDSDVVHTSGKAVFGSRYEEASAGTKLPISDLAYALGWLPEYDLDDIIDATARELRQGGMEVAA